MTGLWPQGARVAELPFPGAGETVIVWLDLDQQHASSTWQSALSPDELVRAARYRLKETRRRFVCGRGQLRVVLGHLLGVAPGDVTLETPPLGKPRLAPGALLRFNLAHDGSLGVLVLNAEGEVGVDVHTDLVGEPDLPLLNLCLTRRERRHYDGLSDGGRPLAFYRCWTRKEALLKAAGWGLLKPPDLVEVPVGPLPDTLPVGLGRTGGPPLFWLRDVSPSNACVAALATAEPVERVASFWIAD